ncbi:MAG: 6,7-dimethyl-8-ribityllumazine synthase [Chitinophagaceae bacterium]|nr:MAG: 6,7-dimethyl-8-ribityllumazine synthase [Chitinophagaceae bacterium]
MSSSLNSPSLFDESKIPSAQNMRFGVVVSEWNQVITDTLRDGCIETLKKFGAKDDAILEILVPGSFELVPGAQMLAELKSTDAIICLGCVVKGETKHDDYINNAVANGLTQLSIKYKIPFIFGLVTTQNEQQAFDRSGGKSGHKGIESALTAIKMVHLKGDFLSRKN